MSVVTFNADVSDDPECRSTTDLAAELLRTARELAAAQCRWLTLLAEFDRRAGSRRASRARRRLSGHSRDDQPRGL